MSLASDLGGTNYDFINILVKDYSESISSEKGRFFKVFLPDALNTETYRSYSDLMAARDNLSGGIVWCAGGGAYIINKRWVPLVERSSTSARNAGKLTLASGRADTKEELLKPSLILRELFEEILIIRNSKLIVPQISSTENNQFILNYLEPMLTALAQKISLNYSGIQHEETKLLNSLLKDTVEVYEDNVLVSSTKCLVHINEFRDLNCLFACEINLPELNFLEEIKCFDTEFAGLKEGEKALNRRIFVYDLDENKYYSFIHNEGWKIVSDVPQLTAHAAFFVEFLKETISSN